MSVLPVNILSVKEESDSECVISLGSISFLSQLTSTIPCSLFNIFQLSLLLFWYQLICKKHFALGLTSDGHRFTKCIMPCFSVILNCGCTPGSLLLKSEFELLMFTFCKLTNFCALSYYFT